MNSGSGRIARKPVRRCYLCRKTIKRALYAMERSETGEYVPVCNACLREALLRFV